MKLYWSRDIREADRIAIEDAGVPSLTLMENAAAAVVHALTAEVPERLSGTVAILCGKGNNGGDGMAVARLLKGQGVDARVLLAASPNTLSGDGRVQFEKMEAAGVPWTPVWGEAGAEACRKGLEPASLAVDALLGTGLSGPARGHMASLIETLNAWGGAVASVDVPSGLSGDALAPFGPTVRADLTLTLAMAKPCLFTPEGAPLCGTVLVLDIGIPQEAARRVAPAGEALDSRWAASLARPRGDGAHKGEAGHVLLVAGSRGKSGAAVLAARGALRAGAGLVTVATPASVQPVVAASLPEAMTLPLPETADGTLSMDALTPILDFCGGADALGLGPGAGGTAETGALLEVLYARVPRPMAVDADGLNAFAGRAARLKVHAAPRVLTPHPGEMGRLLGVPAAEVAAGRYRLVPEAAEEAGAVFLLKGFRTLLAAPGRPWRLNLTGGPHMAGPGFGDVLTGVVAALLARAVDPFDAASLAAWWHGAAADLASRRLGGYGLLASECADALPEVEGALRSSREAG
jgi:NAD(P)H-hydrate epimerase